MYSSITNYAVDGLGQRVFSFAASVDALSVLKGAIDLIQADQSSSRRSLLQSDDDLGALADVLLVIFDNIETKKAEPDMAKVVEGITKTTIAAETVVMKEVEQLALGNIDATAFVASNTKEKMETRVEAVALPSSFEETLDAALNPDGRSAKPPPGPAKDPPPDKSSSSGTDSGMIIGIVFGTLALAMLIVGGVFLSAKRAKKKRMTEDSSLPMTIDLSSQLYTPYNKKKKDKVAKKYAPSGASSSNLEMTNLSSSQAESLA